MITSCSRLIKHDFATATLFFILYSLFHADLKAQELASKGSPDDDVSTLLYLDSLEVLHSNDLLRIILL